MESEEASDTLDEVSGVAGDTGESSSGVGGELIRSSARCRAENCGVEAEEIVGVAGLL